MIDTDSPQTYFVQVADEDIHHIHLVVMSGTLSEVLRKLRLFAQTTGTTCTIFGLEEQEYQPGQDAFFLHLTKLGKALKSFAKVNRDYEFDSWSRAFSRVFERMSFEQQKAELQTLGARILKELEALRIKQELETTAPKETVL